MKEERIRNAEEATERAASFIKDRYPLRGLVARPVKASRDDHVWTVQLDLGIVRAVIASFKIDGETGEVLEYSIPPLGTAEAG